MILPIMQAPLFFGAFQETNGGQCLDQFAVAGWPINSQFKIFVAKAFKIAIRTILASPKPQANQTPCGFCAEAVN